MSPFNTKLMIVFVAIAMISSVWLLRSTPADDELQLIPTQKRNIILIGGAQSGKTTLINLLKDKDYDPPKYQIFGGTSAPAFESFTITSKKLDGSFNINIVDTPALFEPSLKITDRITTTNKKILDIVKKCIDMEITNINHIYFVMNIQQGINLFDIETFRLVSESFLAVGNRISIIISFAQNIYSKQSDYYIHQFKTNPDLNSMYQRVNGRIFFLGAVQKSFLYDIDKLRQNVYNQRAALFEHISQQDTSFNVKSMNIYSGSDFTPITTKLGNKIEFQYTSHRTELYDTKAHTSKCFLDLRFIMGLVGSVILFLLTRGTIRTNGDAVFSQSSQSETSDNLNNVRYDTRSSVQQETIPIQSSTKNKIARLILELTKKSDALVTVFGRNTQSNSPPTSSKRNNTTSNNGHNRHGDKDDKNIDSNNSNNPDGNNGDGSDDDDEKKDKKRQPIEIDEDSDEEREKEVEKFFELLAIESSLDDEQLSEYLSQFLNLSHVYKRMTVGVVQFNRAMKRISAQTSLTYPKVTLVTQPNLERRPSPSDNGYSSKSENLYQLSSENESNSTSCKTFGKRKRKRRKKKKKWNEPFSKTKYKYDFQNSLSTNVEHEKKIKENILTTKWYHTQAIQSANIYGVSSPNGRLTLSLEVSEVMRRCERIVKELKSQKESMVLKSIAMLDGNHNSSVQYLLVTQIDAADKIHIGISFRYIATQKEFDIVLTGFHLDLKSLNIVCASGVNIGYLNIYSQTEHYYENRYRKLLPFIREFILEGENEFILMNWKIKAQRLWKDVMGTTSHI